MKDKIRRRRSRIRLTEGRREADDRETKHLTQRLLWTNSQMWQSPLSVKSTHVHTQTHSLEVKSGYNMYRICNPAQWRIFQLGWDILMSHLAH